MTRKIKNAKSGFTMMEILMVLVVIGIMAGLALPAYQGTMEKSRANEAVINLNAIYLGQKLYLSDKGSYYPASGSDNVLSTINSNLNINLESNFYRISVLGGASTFLATATRTAASGGDDTSTITINQKGCFDGTSAHKPINTRACP